MKEFLIIFMPFMLLLIALLSDIAFTESSPFNNADSYNIISFDDEENT